MQPIWPPVFEQSIEAAILWAVGAARNWRFLTAGAIVLAQSHKYIGVIVNRTFARSTSPLMQIATGQDAEQFKAQLGKLRRTFSRHSSKKPDRRIVQLELLLGNLEETACQPTPLVLDTHAGGEGAAAIYSLIETAKLDGLQRQPCPAFKRLPCQSRSGRWTKIVQEISVRSAADWICLSRKIAS